ncbi:pseudouridine synthase [Shewanella algidipiscicola]|uniref:RNA pseudouridylate synthase n=1 Tax=Shewanella algidipiscicola TaxID=614070 RepID=A0ABQ4PEL7_9GAMM|nr:pseudouridine synthase [Shewanella algidipiscicola]GIU45978.1 RNA pseudouridylate synthase [Shewanella algidipiscicola]
MVRASQASYIVLPDHPSAPATVVEFLMTRFSQVSAQEWQSRVRQGKVHWLDGQPIELDSAYRPKQRVYYYREVAQEPRIPFSESILYQDERIIIAHKPHFLALHPSGQFINECLVNRLRIATQVPQLVPAHRLDRATAGIVLLIKQPEYRDAYHGLFRDGAITKTYQALASLTPALARQYSDGQLASPLRWTVKNRLVKSEPSFMMQVTDGEANSHSEVALVEVQKGMGRFELSPITGKTHQLRVHMHSLGMPICNDRCYPSLLPKAADNFAQPLKLLAQRLQFSDPISGRHIDIQLADLPFSEAIIKG